jgi:hypothetical protein
MSTPYFLRYCVISGVFSKIITLVNVSSREIISNEGKMNFYDSVQIKQLEFHRRRIFETKLCLVAGIILSLILLFVWHLNLVHRLAKSQQGFSSFDSAKISSINVQRDLVRQYAAIFQNLQNQRGCLKNLLVDLNKIFPPSLNLIALEKVDDMVMLSGQALVLSEVTRLSENIGKLNRYQYHLPEIKNIGEYTNGQISNFSVELRCSFHS